MEMLYESYADDIFRHIMFRIRNREKALDMTQEVFLRIWNSYISKGKKLEYPKALLYKIAHNLVVNSYERDVNFESLDLMTEEGFEVKDNTQDFNKFFDQKDLYQALDKIPKKDSEIIILKYIEGFSVKEIAEIQEVSENTLSVRLHRALASLESIYNKESQTQNE